MLNFPYKQFVKAKNDDNSLATSETSRRQTIKNGEEIQKFYEELIKEPSEKKQVKIEIKQEKDIKKEKWVKVKIKQNTKIKKENDIKIEVKKENIKYEEVLISDSDDDLSIVDPKSQTKLFQASQIGDLTVIRSLLKSGVNINCRDEFGWSPLMIAAAEGNNEIVQELLVKGADKKNTDKQGRDAAHLARLKGHFHVENMIQFYNPPKRNKNRRKNTRNKDGEEFDTCQICHEIYPANKLKEHQVSLTHQLEMDKITQETAEPGFIIPPNNKGYKLLKQSGWDGKSGLGTAEHKGRLFPVKSVLKRDRTGIQEGVRKEARITHFGANDEESIKIVKRDYNPDAKKPKTNAFIERQIRESLGDL